MKKLLLTLFIISSFAHSEKDYLTKFAVNIEHLNSLESSLSSTEKQIDLKPMAASIVVPGLGQLINKEPIWKTALFFGIEVVGLASYFSWTNQADNLTSEYKDWADAHWNMERWVGNSSTLMSIIQSNGYPEVDDILIDGSHHITIVVDGVHRSSDILTDDPDIDYVEIRDWDFYEGIGKYDQFVAGWDDALTDWDIVEKDISNGQVELIVMTPNKQYYLDLRNDSNILYRNAKFALTAVVFNHVFSALDALWNTDNKKELSYKLDVSKQINNSFVIRGISVEWTL